MNNRKCSHNSCNYEIYDSNKEQKCIFHCSKDDWYSIQNGKKFWNEEKVKEFWRRIREEKVTKKDYSFLCFVFPKFEKYPNAKQLNLDSKEWELVQGIKNIESINTLILDDKIDGINFWRRNSQLVFEKDVYFDGSKFLDGANFDKIRFEKKLNFIGCEFYGDVFLRYISFNEDAIFTAVTFNDRVFIYKSELINSTFTFLDTKFNSRIVIKNLTNKNSKLNFDYTHFLENSIVFLSEIEIDYLHIQNLYNFSENFRITNLKVNNDLKIIDTNLNNIEFTNNDFSSIPIITFKGASFDNVKFNNIKWGSINLKRFGSNRDIFRQIKHQYDQQSNIIDANKFYSAEMNAYKKEIKNEKWRTHWQDKIIFCLSRISSNFSKNFFLPVFCLFISSSLFYLISFYKLDYSKIESFNVFSNHIFSTDWKLIFNEILLYANPFNTKLKGSALLWILHKSFSTYFIYQFVVALRRQTKR